MKKAIGLCFILLLAAAMVSAQDGEGRFFKMFVQDETGNLSLVDAMMTETGELVAAAGACNGGTCLTSHGVSLTCPASGGPTCKEGEVCSCKCVKNSDDTWSAVNKCVKALAADEEEPF